MCGRFTLHHSAKEIASRFGVEFVPEGVVPRFNVAPQQMILGICENDEREAKLFKWGLVPAWAKDPKLGYRMINARAETVAEKPSYKRALARRRCLIPADGFYEWTSEAGQKVPMHIRFTDSRLFAFAGLWEQWRSPDGDSIESCTIITVPPNRLVKGIHNRMPAILRRDEEEQWLSPDVDDPASVLRFLNPFPDEEMEAFPVATIVNSPANDDERCIEPAIGG